MSKTITTDTLQKAITWYDYEQLLKTLVREHKTTGADQSEKMVEYTKMNLQRVKRIGKTILLRPEMIQLLQQLPVKLKWVVIVEAWCGDVANNLPVINMMVDASPNLELFLLFRDENPEVVDAHLTNGARSIPKLICLDESLKELGTWGPKPAPLMDLLYEYKHGSEPKMSHDDYARRVQLWYAADRGQTLQSEMMDLIRSWVD
jgi:hypothetical protein